jgi:hypothetical protein
LRMLYYAYEALAQMAVDHGNPELRRRALGLLVAREGE